MSFKIGDVVVLKSGSPKMTVTVIMKSGSSFYCTWFDASGKATDKEFPADALRLFVEDPK